MLSRVRAANIIRSSTCPPPPLRARVCRYGSNLEEFDQDGYTPLLLAARRGFLDLVQHFVLKGANINARVKTLENIYQLSLPHPEVHDWLSSIKHFSKLHVAASLRRADVVKVLLHAGENPHEESPMDDLVRQN